MLISNELWDEKVELYNDLMEKLAERYSDDELIEIINVLVKYERKSIELELHSRVKFKAVS